MDINMPKMNGWQTIQAMIDQGLAEGNIIAMLTGQGAPDPEAECIKEWVLDYITKPFDVKMLADLIETYAAGLYPTIRPKAKTYVSPRIGISHPLSERSKIYFNYGHFVSTPKSEYLYRAQSDWSKPRITYFGNPEMGFTKTIAYELGGDLNVGQYLTLHVGAFYKDNRRPL